MTELVQHTGDLAQQMEYARVVSSGAMLPQPYRGKPADILIAVGLGQAMGLSPAESLYRIDVIQGKPTAAAELIAANVRKAGHKLRVTVTEEPPSATATIIRSDDPEFPFEVTRDLSWAQNMGLVNKDNYKKQPSTMLSWRAISAVARLACPEALYGVAYTPDEMRDLGTVESTVQRASAADFGVQPAAKVGATMNDEPVDAEVVEAVAEERADTQPETPSDEWPNDLTDNTRKKMFAVFNKHGIKDRDAQILGIARVIGRQIQSRSEVTEDEAQRVILSVEAHFAGAQA